MLDPSTGLPVAAIGDLSPADTLPGLQLTQNLSPNYGNGNNQAALALLVLCALVGLWLQYRGAKL